MLVGLPNDSVKGIGVSIKVLTDSPVGCQIDDAINNRKPIKEKNLRTKENKYKKIF